jgi:antitoxin PrlF
MKRGYSMLVTDKGQITIPKAVRQAAGMVPGTEVNVCYEAGKIIVEKLSNGRSSDRRAQMRKAAAKAREGMSAEYQALSADEILAFLRG